MSALTDTKIGFKHLHNTVATDQFGLSEDLIVDHIPRPQTQRDHPNQQL